MGMVVAVTIIKGIITKTMTGTDGVEAGGEETGMSPFMEANLGDLGVEEVVTRNPIITDGTVLIKGTCQNKFDNFTMNCIQVT